MKLYIPSLDINKQTNINIKNISKYNIHKECIENYYTKKGIYRFESDVYKKYLPIDHEILKYNTERYEIWMDKSCVKYIDTYYNIGTEYVYLPIIKFIYKLHKTKSLSLIIEFNKGKCNENSKNSENNNINDIYFEIDNKINKDNKDKKKNLYNDMNIDEKQLKEWKEQIDTFLLELNFY